MSKSMKIVSLQHLLYCLGCVVTLICMALYEACYPAKVSNICLLISLLMLLGNVLNPFGLVSAIVNIVVCIRRRCADGWWPSLGVFVWAAAGPLLSLLLGLMAMNVFVDCTGGV